jgi:ABC-2 type transport system ATP-binding protein
MLNVQNISKSYGAIEALKGVGFTVNDGEIVGLLGPNGAGKTTTIKILTGYLQPDEGNVYIDGLDVLEHIRQVQAQIGYLPETAPLYPELSVQRYLLLVAALREIPEGEQLQRIAEAVHDVGLADHLTRPIGQLSKGYRQRVGLAQAILHRPRLLILDEPSIGLDPTQIVEMRALIKRLSQHSTILFSTHILSEVEALCDRVVILLDGQVRSDAHLAELAATADAVLVLSERPQGAAEALRRLPGVRAVESLTSSDGHPGYRLRGRADADVDLLPEVYGLVQAQGWPLRELHRDVRTLETVFNELATR